MYCIGFTFMSDLAYFIYFNLKVSQVLGSYKWSLNHVILWILSCLNKETNLLSYQFFSLFDGCVY